MTLCNTSKKAIIIIDFCVALLLMIVSTILFHFFFILSPKTQIISIDPSGINHRKFRYQWQLMTINGEIIDGIFKTSINDSLGSGYFFSLDPFDG